MISIFIKARKVIDPYQDSILCDNCNNLIASDHYFKEKKVLDKRGEETKYSYGNAFLVYIQQCEEIDLCLKCKDEFVVEHNNQNIQYVKTNTEKLKKVCNQCDTEICKHYNELYYWEKDYDGILDTFPITTNTDRNNLRPRKVVEKVVEPKNASETYEIPTKRRRIQ